MTRPLDGITVVSLELAIAAHRNQNRVALQEFIDHVFGALTTDH